MVTIDPGVDSFSVIVAAVPWPDLSVWVAAAQFAVGLDGEAAAAFGELVPEPAVIHHLAEQAFVCEAVMIPAWATARYPRSCGRSAGHTR
jgi:hypothetical protein